MPRAMDEFARLPADGRRPYIEEAASRRHLTAVIIGKDFWACWTLRQLAPTPELREVTFKGCFRRASHGTRILLGNQSNAEGPSCGHSQWYCLCPEPDA